jgi:hypothetical protein
MPEKIMTGFFGFLALGQPGNEYASYSIVVGAIHS